MAALVGLLWAPAAVRAQEPEGTASPAVQGQGQQDAAEPAAGKDGKAEPSSAGKRFQVREVVGSDRKYSVQEGENLYEVARHHDLAMEHVAWANGLPVDLAPLAEEEVVLPNRRILPADPPTDGVVVNLPERGLYLFQGGEFAGFYPLAIGQDGKYETPTGEYEILDKQVNPTWRVPEFAEDKYKDEVVKPGPDNPLGDRWIGITTDGLGFHSTNEPSYIGDAVSHGCLRLYPPQAREFYEKAEMGMPVRIEYEPVKVGRSGDRYYLAVFPDVYEELDMEAEVRKALKSAGLDPLPGDELASLVENPTGLAKALPQQVARGKDDEDRASRDSASRVRDDGNRASAGAAATGRSPEEAAAETSTEETSAAEPWWRSLLSRLGFLGGGTQAAGEDR